MPDLIRYDLLAQDALRSVVKKVLTDAARRGLPGDHHFFVAFDTRAPGVKMSERLRTEHPEQMTIVLQHQFWDLVVGDNGFEVGLSFKGMSERLVVPFEAIKGFYDPSVQFGLQFETITEAQAAPAQAANESVAGKSAGSGASERQSSRPTPRGAASEPEERPATSVPSTRTKKRPAAVSAETPAAEKPAKAAADKSAGAEVVSLDKFRKK
jgi:uncharacterized protein